MNRTIARLLLAAALVIGSSSGAGQARAAVTTALTPVTQTVAPGDTFFVYFDVLAAGSLFNGFDLVVHFDPAAVTLLADSVTAQQGCLMTGGCSAACGNTFHRFSAAGDSAVANNVLLCNSFALTGPGRLYRLRFRASNTIQTTTVDVRRARFYNAGLFVTPVITANATIGIGVNLGVGDGGSTLPVAWRAEPNPSSGRIEFRSEGDETGLVTGEVLDLQGRVVQRWAPVWVGARGRLAWDGRGAQGARLPAGLYLVRLQRGHQVQTTRVTLLP